jgi:cobalt/nickel transport system permease protein
VHIPDGYLGPQTYAVLDVAIIPIWAVAAVKVRKSLKAKQIPLLALGAAFSFVIMMFNVPVVGGSTGHAVGGTLIAILLGPWAAVVSVSIALVIQALLFGDGGITAIGANCINMAVILPFVGYYTYRLVAGSAPKYWRRVAAAGVGAYMGILAAAIAAGFEFGIQPLIAHNAAGQALYAPYPLNVAVPAMALEHAFFFGPIEAMVCAGIVAVLARQDSALLEMRPASRPLTWLWAALGILILLTPVGVLAPGTAWGEWSAAEMQKLVGYVPNGMAQVGSGWSAMIPDYAPAFNRNPLLGYLVAAVVGSALVIGATWGIGWLLRMGKKDDPDGTTPPAPAS